MRNGTNFAFESVDLLSYHIHETTMKRRKSYIKSPKWVISKKGTENPKNEDNRYFQYSIIVALHHQEIGDHPERLSNMHHFFSYCYNWEDIEVPAGIKDWKRFEKNNETTALNILFVPHEGKTINLAYKSKYNRECKNQVFLLRIANGEKWHYTALTSEPTEDGFNRPTKCLSKLFRGKTSNHNGDFYFLNCLHSFRTDEAFEKHERLSCNKDYCNAEMAAQLNKILKYDHGEKSFKTPFVIYVDFM